MGKVDIIRVCCVCKAVEDNGQWQQRDIAAASQVTHGYCPACYHRARLAMVIRRENRRAKSVPASITPPPQSG